MHVEHIEKYVKKKMLFISILLSLLVLLIPLAVSMGTYNAGLLDVFNVLLGNNDLSTEVKAVLLLRTRRVFASILLGGILGVGGVCIQAAMRNPMASPFTLGISHAAALGVALSLILGVSGSVRYRVIQVSNPYITTLFALGFALVQVVIVLTLAYRAGLTERSLVLAAIATSFFYQAVLSLVQYLLLNELQLAVVVYWLFGDIGRVDWTGLWVLTVVFVFTALYCFLRAIDLDLISLGDDVAASSGVDPKRLRLEVVLIATVGASISTAFAGVLAFLCLVAPHVSRLLLGGTHRYLIPGSILTGALLTLVADTLGRLIIKPMVLPAGIILSLIGAPLLVLLLVRGGR